VAPRRSKFIAAAEDDEMGAPGIEPGTYGLKTTPSHDATSEAPSGADVTSPRRVEDCDDPDDVPRRSGFE
jgi:hypothetical protein